MTVSSAILWLAAVGVNAACASWIGLAWVSIKLNFFFLALCWTLRVMAARVDPELFFSTGTVRIVIARVQLNDGRIASRIIVTRVSCNQTAAAWIIVTGICSRNDRGTAARVVIAWIKSDEGRVASRIVVARIVTHLYSCTA